MKLTKTQADLLIALQGGDTVHYMGYMGRFNPNAYYFLSSTHGRVTAAAKALKKHGLIQHVGDYQPKVVLTLAGKAWKPESTLGVGNSR